MRLRISRSYGIRTTNFKAQVIWVWEAGWGVTAAECVKWMEVTPSALKFCGSCDEAPQLLNLHQFCVPKQKCSTTDNCSKQFSLSPDNYQCACRVLQSKSFCFAPGHQWKWYRLIKSELPWFLLCIAPLIPCFGNVVEGGGVPKFLLNTVRWWLKPLYTFCTGHIFEKSSLWNWISLTWASFRTQYSNLDLKYTWQVCDIVEPLEMLV